MGWRIQTRGSKHGKHDIDQLLTNTVLATPAVISEEPIGLSIGALQILRRHSLIRRILMPQQTIKTLLMPISGEQHADLPRIWRTLLLDAESFQVLVFDNVMRVPPEIVCAGGLELSQIRVGAHDLVRGRQKDSPAWPLRVVGIRHAS
jgi:hypothetical protein